MRQVVVLLFVLFAAGCSHMIFQPTKDLYIDPVKAEKYLKIKLEDVYFKSLDATELHGWFVPNQVGKTRGTILFLHGNGQNISTHLSFVWWLARSGYDVFLFDYRGYGASAGEPTLEGVHLDVQGAMRTLLARPDIQRNKLVLYGHSLGGALAITSLVDSPYRDNFRALIVESAFTSYRTVAREALDHFWLTWLFQYPLSWTIRDDYQPLAAIARVSPIPLLLINGSADRVVEVHHSKDLFEAAKQPKEYWLIEGAGHNVFETESLRQRLLDYLDRILK